MPHYRVKVTITKTVHDTDWFYVIADDRDGAIDEALGAAEIAHADADDVDTNPRHVYEVNPNDPE